MIPWQAPMLTKEKLRVMTGVCRMSRKVKKFAARDKWTRRDASEKDPTRLSTILIRATVAAFRKVQNALRS